MASFDRHGLRSSDEAAAASAPDVDQGLPPRRRNVDDLTDHHQQQQQLATKLLQQNARLKNLVRQLIADRGLTVADYLVRLARRSYSRVRE